MSSRLASLICLTLAQLAPIAAHAADAKVPQADKGFVCTDKYDRKHLVVQAFEQTLREADNQIKPVVPSSWNDFKNPDDSIGFDLQFIGTSNLVQVQVKHLPGMADKLLALAPDIKQQLGAPMPALLCMRTKPNVPGGRKIFVQLVGVGAVAPYVGTPVEIERNDAGIITASVGALGLSWSRDITRLQDEGTASAATP